MTEREPGYEVARIEELEALPVDDEGLMWRPVRRRFDIRAFGVNAYTAASAGQRVVEEHAEPENHEELYAVVAGRATFALGGDEVDAPAGTLVFVRPGTLRGAVAREDGTTVLAIGAKRGVVFEPSAWEDVFVGNGYAKLGDLERARETFRGVTERQPDEWRGWFNWACVEARQGDREAAFSYLERAAELDPSAVAEYAPRDEDFASIRDDPRFRALAAG